MVKDLVSRNLLPGKPREDVLELLGAPDNQFDSLLEYHVGYMGFNRNAPMTYPYSLHIVFDDAGTVSKVYIDD